MVRKLYFFLYLGRLQTWPLMSFRSRVSYKKCERLLWLHHKLCLIVPYLYHFSLHVFCAPCEIKYFLNKKKLNSWLAKSNFIYKKGFKFINGFRVIWTGVSKLTQHLFWRLSPSKLQIRNLTVHYPRYSYFWWAKIVPFSFLVWIRS